MMSTVDDKFLPEDRHISYAIVHRSRPRNAAATRAAILEAARGLFTELGYDDVGMRDIARQVGVDAAMVSRYFGSKEDLYAEVLDSCSKEANTLIEGERSDFGRRIAHELVYEEQECDKLRGLLIMLRSNGSAKANEVVRRVIFAKFLDPFRQWLGGDQADIRARVTTSLVMGFAVNRLLIGDSDLDEAAKKALFERLAVMLQASVDD